MPVEVLVKRSGVPRPTVFRILRGGADTVRFGHVQQVVGVLGLAFGRTPEDPEKMRKKEAKLKARQVVRLTQGTMALESQAVSSAVLAEIERDAMLKLLSGPGKKLWSD